MCGNVGFAEYLSSPIHIRPLIGKKTAESSATRAWEEEMKIHCWYCGKKIRMCQWATYRVPINDRDRIKRWFHSFCFKKHEEEENA